MTLSLLTIGLLAINYSACSNSSKQTEAQTLLAEINGIARDNDHSINSVPPELWNALSRSEVEKYPRNKTALIEAAGRVIPYYDHDLRRFHIIAQKYEQMGRLNLNADYMESVTTQRRLYENYARLMELQIARLELLSNPEIADRSTLIQRSSEFESQIEEVKKEIVSLGGKG